MTRVRLLVAALTLAIAGPAAAEPTRFGDESAPNKLTIWAATDRDSISTLIQAYLKTRPDVTISYDNMKTNDLNDAIRKGDHGAPDIAISSAADLQVRLVNDGYAMVHEPPAAPPLPAWQNWRNQAFGVTVEPAVTVYSKTLASIGPLPRTRLDLAALISKHQDLLTGKIATYDIERSGIGYLFATEDSLYSSTYTTLAQSFGSAKTRLFSTSREMLDLLDKGEMLVGYNILGSYALQMMRQGGQIEILLPQDYTLVLSRVAILPVGARRHDLGASFLDFLLSPAAQALQPSLADYENLPFQGHARFAMHPIVLGPTLLVFLDQQKKGRFTQTWRKLIAIGD